MAIKLTIGTAVYNVGEEFLRLHIEGVAKQLTDEVEFLLIDDCSTDNSGEICREYAEKDSRIRYIKMEKNGGLSCVRNRTIDEAEGKWIFFADGDDLLSGYFVKTALSFYDSDDDIIIHDRGVFTKQKPDESPCDVKELIAVPDGAGRELSLSSLCLKPIDLKKYNLGSEVFYHAAWGAIYSKRFLTENNLKFPEGQKKAQDSVFNTYAYYEAKRIAYLPYTMYFYRKNMQGITKRYSADFTDMAKSLIGHHYNCIKNIYFNDKDVEALYKKHRVISLALDAMKLNFFHKNNPNSRKVRKKGFTDFVNTEPFKSAIDNYETDKNAW